MVYSRFNYETTTFQRLTTVSSALCFGILWQHAAIQSTYGMVKKLFARWERAFWMAVHNLQVAAAFTAIFSAAHVLYNITLFNMHTWRAII